MLPKNYTEFERTLAQLIPPAVWPDALKALWFDAKGDWEGSHNIAQDMDSTMGSWIHAYLHRKEGDAFNAAYWYRKAGKDYTEISVKDELRNMVAFVLERS